MRLVWSLGLCAATMCAAAELPPAQGTFVADRCLDCHDSETKKGGLVLEKFPFDPQDAKNLETWVKVYDRVRGGEMPPKKKPQPSPRERDHFTKALAASLVAAERSQTAYAGRSVLRRMNRYEYENTLRDLLGTPWLQLRDMLPEDGEAHRFNKAGEALDVSHVQIARYLSAADYALHEAMAPQAAKPGTTVKRYYTRQENSFTGKYDLGGTQDRKTFPVLGAQGDPASWSNHQAKVFSSKDPKVKELEGVGVVVSTYEPTEIRFSNFRAPVSGRYKLRFLANSIWVAPISQKQYWQPNRELVSPSTRAEPVTVYSDRQPRILRELGHFDATPDGKVAELDVWLLAGETIRPDAARLFRSRPPDHHNPLATTNGMPGVSFRWMEVEGPLIDAWPPPGHKILFGDLPVGDPASAAGAPAGGRKPRFGKPDGVRVLSPAPAADAERLLRAFIARAYRRPATESDVKLFLPVVLKAYEAEQDFAESLFEGYAAVLASPAFLYFDEKPGRLDDRALAARLSYFLWNSCPDGTLRALAEQGALRDAKTLRAQADRLLDDPKARQFVDAFLDYWLDLRKIAATAPDSALYPDYQLDDLLVESMIDETRLFFWSLVKRDFGARHLVASDFAVLNERLATHYGIPGVTGVAMRPVKLPAGSLRGGLLTQASVLKVTANGTTTSPVLRGAWIMDRILGRPVPPPPAAVPAVEPDIRGATTIRDQLARHRDQESCAVCHRKMDPPGFALESFDVMGGLRSTYRAVGTGEKLPGFGHNGLRIEYHEGLPVDSSGELPDGRRFAGISDLKKLLAADEEQLAENLVKQLMIYATGSPVRFSDRPQLEAILSRGKSKGFGVRTLIHEIVQSDLFQTK